MGWFTRHKPKNYAVRTKDGILTAILTPGNAQVLLSSNHGEWRTVKLANGESQNRFVMTKSGMITSVGRTFALTLWPDDFLQLEELELD